MQSLDDDKWRIIGPIVLNNSVKILIEIDGNKKILENL